MIHRMVEILALAIPLTGLSAACSRAGSRESGWVAEIWMEGEVRTVRTVRGSVWGEPARLVVETSIGGGWDEEGQILGQVVSIATDAERIYVLDMQIPAVRVYDDQGRHLFDIGRAGSGPGEFRQPTSLACDIGSGRLFVRDGSEDRINVFSRDGETLATWRLNIGMQTNRPLVLTSERRLFTPIVIRSVSEGRSDRWAMVECGPQGATGDTLFPPELSFRPAELVAVRNGRIKSTRVPFSPTAVWSMSPRGSMIAGVSGDYRLWIRHCDGRTTVIEKEGQPVPVVPEEKSWHRRVILADMNRWLPGWAWNGPDIPDRKPAFSEIMADRDGRIWILRPGPGQRREECTEDPSDLLTSLQNPCWQDAQMLDVFEESGRFLGEVGLPEGIRLASGPFSPRPHIEGATVVALVEREGGYPAVVRFPMVTSAREDPRSLHPE
jgi:hypothetical protein